MEAAVVASVVGTFTSCSFLQMLLVFVGCLAGLSRVNIFEQTNRNGACRSSRPRLFGCGDQEGWVVAILRNAGDSEAERDMAGMKIGGKRCLRYQFTHSLRKKRRTIGTVVCGKVAAKSKVSKCASTSRFLLTCNQSSHRFVQQLP